MSDKPHPFCNDLTGTKHDELISLIDYGVETLKRNREALDAGMCLMLNGNAALVYEQAVCELIAENKRLRKGLEDISLDEQNAIECSGECHEYARKILNPTSAQSGEPHGTSSEPST